MSLRKFLTSKVFLLNLLGAILLGVAVVYGTFIGMNMYTHHGEKIEVPDFTGLNLAMVKRVCNQNTIRYEVVDSIFSSSASPGTVIDQKPKPGFNVKENRTIFLTICAHNPEQVQMPKLTDLSLRQAKAVLVNSGLELGEIKYHPSEFVDLVLEQHVNGESVSAGAMIYKGTRVDLIIGEGLSRETIAIPNLFGVTLEEAKNIAQEKTLSIGAIVYDESIEDEADSLNARVWRQLPPVELGKVEKGTSIDIWISVDETKFVRTSDEAGLNTEEELF